MFVPVSLFSYSGNSFPLIAMKDKSVLHWSWPRVEKLFRSPASHFISFKVSVYLHVKRKIYDIEVGVDSIESTVHLQEQRNSVWQKLLENLTVKLFYLWSSTTILKLKKKMN